jgi:hypothetical protein
MLPRNDVPIPRPHTGTMLPSVLSISISLSVVVCSATARAEQGSDIDSVLPCRPTIACTADIGPPGDFELEIGYLFRQFKKPAHQQSIPFLLKLTVTRWLQLQLGGNGPTFENAPVATRYVDDIVGAAKFYLRDQTSLSPSLSVSTGLSVPLGAADGYVRTYDILTTVYATKELGWLHADLNVGLDAWRIGGPVEWQPWTALAVSLELPRQFTVMAESYYFANASPIAPRDGGMLGALAYSPWPNLVLDAGGDLGYFPSERAFSIFVGITTGALLR